MIAMAIIAGVVNVLAADRVDSESVALLPLTKSADQNTDIAPNLLRQQVAERESARNIVLWLWK